MHTYEIGVEVELDTQLKIYDGDGVLLTTENIYPSSSTPDWRADLANTNCSDCDWPFDWNNETTDLLTLEFRVVEGAFQSVSTYVKRYVYVPSSPRTQGTFWSPADNVGSLDILFDVFANPTEVKADGPLGSPFEDVFAGNYVIPYDGEYYCQQESCPTTWDNSTQFFLSPVDYIPNATTRTFTLAPEANSVYQSSWNAVWDVPNLKLQFHPQRSFLIKGDFDATGVTFTSVDPTPDHLTGWGGLRFEPGSSGSLENSVIEGVGGHGSYSLWITNASPDIVDTRVRDAAGLGVGGIYITGSTAKPYLEGNQIENTTWSGISLASSAYPRLVQNTIVGNEGWGITAGMFTGAWLSPPYGSTPGVGSFGNRVEDNADGGISSYAATLNFGWYWYVSGGGYHVDGYNSVVGNGGIGLRATNTGRINAGGTSNMKMNRVFGNDTADAVADGSGSRVYARCDWWNDTTPPFRTTELDGGLVYDDYYLLADPYVDTDAPCINGSVQMRSTAMEGTGSTDATAGQRSLRDRFGAAVEISGPDPTSAVAMLSRIVDEGGDDAVLYAAVAEIGYLLTRDEVTDDAREMGQLLLQSSAESPSLGLRSAALRALVLSHARRGEIRDAIETAESLIDEQGLSTEDALFGHVALANLHAEAGGRGKALEALAVVEKLSPGSLEAVKTRHTIDALFGVEGQELVDGRVDAFESSKRMTTSDVSTLVHTANTAEHAFRLLAPFPNPSRDQVAVPFTLTESAHVQLEVYDLLGRRVVHFDGGRYMSGTHEVRLDVAHIPAGTYLIRATATAEASGTRVQTRTLAVAE